MILLHIIQKLRSAERCPPAGLTPFRVMDLHGHEPLRIRVRKRLHQDVVDHAENCRGRPNSQRQRNHSHHSKSRRLSQVPQRIPQILPQCSHEHLPSLPLSGSSAIVVAGLSTRSFPILRWLPYHSFIILIPVTHPFAISSTSPPAQS